MRTFIIKANEAHTRADFKLSDLPGTSGRIDVLCRFLNSAFLLSHGFRKNVRVWLLLYGPPDPPKAIRFEGPELKVRLNPDERSTAKLIMKALKMGEGLREPGKEVEVYPGLYISNRTFEDVIRLTLKNSTLYYLHEEGKPVKDVQFSGNVAFVLGDHKGLDAEDEAFLDGIAERVSVGEKSYLASHVVAYTNILLDSLPSPP
ncbi:MAG: tRNA (pseudouridine(54)-N(1))-methyltransferase TrmY [Thermococcus sp.]|nr:tRNA (pseudouridine(54)-N(1))-methyltransferase TrmY [Thermococcus sp.]